ncbi:hypothetical protein L345_03565, partial [Ophiophagus hannah]
MKYIPGGKKILADNLSRKPQFDTRREEVVQTMISEAQSAGQVTTQGQANFNPRCLEDKLTTELKAALLSDPWFLEHQTKLTMNEGLAWKGTKLYVPANLRLMVLKCSHDLQLGDTLGS